MTLIHLAPELEGIVTVAALHIEGAVVLECDPQLDAPMAEAAARMRQLGDAGARVVDVRAMYKKFGIDPTKTRPSSEALLRRVRKGDSLPRINSLVDIINWCSLETQLPFGLYDLDRISGSVELRVGRPGEEYAGIRKDAVHVAGRPTLADDIGAFGNPTSDSARSMVTTATTRALVVIFAPASLPADELRSALDLTAARILQFAGGRETARQ